MKLLTITYDAGIEQSLTDLLNELEVASWTRIYGLHGKGESGVKVNTPIWPGSNNQIVLVGEENMLRAVAEQIRVMQSGFRLRPGIFLVLQDVEVL